MCADHLIYVSDQLCGRRFARKIRCWDSRPKYIEEVNILTIFTPSLAVVNEPCEQVLHLFLSCKWRSADAAIEYLLR